MSAHCWTTQQSVPFSLNLHIRSHRSLLSLSQGQSSCSVKLAAWLTCTYSVSSAHPQCIHDRWETLLINTVLWSISLHLSTAKCLTCVCNSFTHHAAASYVQILCSEICKSHHLLCLYFSYEEIVKECRKEDTTLTHSCSHNM